MRTRAALPLILVAAVGACAKPAPDGAVELKAAQQKFQKLDHVTLESTRKTELGTFTQTAEIDCALRYYHYRYVKDLSAKGIESGTTQMQGRPRAHQEEERLFILDTSYSRYSGTWETAGAGDDAHPQWGKTPNNYDPQEDCNAIHAGTDSPFMPLKAMIAQNQIAYVDTRTESDTECRAYRVAFPEVVFPEKTTKLVRATVCVAVADGLPRRLVKDDSSVKLSYGLIVPLPAPAIPAS